VKIDKTQMMNDGRHYQAARIGGMDVLLPMPCLFRMQGQDGSVYQQQLAAEPISRTLVVYDNAGEHFLPVSEYDSAKNPGTRHLALAEAVIFLFDPTLDPGFRKAAQPSDDIQLTLGDKVRPQDVLFTEAMNRIRRNLNLDARAMYDRPVTVVVSKADVLGDEFAKILETVPWEWNPDVRSFSLNCSYLMQVSFLVRSLLEAHAPHFVSAVESVASDVSYFPASALGHSPTMVRREADGGQPVEELMVRPADVHSQWVEVPLLYALHKLGYLPGITYDPDPSHPVPAEYHAEGDTISFLVPGTDEPVKVPRAYAGVSLRSYASGTWFRVPVPDGESDQSSVISDH
jgi:hypothetical protein